jgi:hypothetical protein
MKVVVNLLQDSSWLLEGMCQKKVDPSKGLIILVVDSNIRTNNGCQYTRYTSPKDAKVDLNWATMK